MNFDPRLSTTRPTPSTKHRKETEEESFMTLPDREIAGCINDIGIPFSTSDLQKPQPQQIQRVFEWFADILMNTTRESVAPAMKAAAEDVVGPYAEIFGADARDLMGLFVVLKQLLRECGIMDFALSDLYRPVRERLVKIFSYIINFIRFRESQTSLIDEHFNASEKTKQRIETLYTDIQDSETHLTNLERNKAATEALIREKEARSNELKEKLLGLKRGQERVVELLDRSKEDSSKLKRTLEERTSAVVSARQESTKLRPYTTQSPAALEASLQKLNADLNADREQIERLERRARALLTSTDAFHTVSADVRSLIAQLGDLEKELAHEEATKESASRNRDALTERSQNVREVDRQEKILRKKLDNVTTRTEKLLKSAEERREAEERKMAELKKISEELRKDRNEKQREMERRRVKIEQTEKKMADLKENIETEVHAAQEEYVKMESHIRLYIEEMEGSLVLA